LKARGENIAFLLLVLLALLGYANSFQNEFLHWDDYGYILDNHDLRGFSLANFKKLVTSFYIGEWFPLQMISYWIEYNLWGQWVTGYHIVNFIFHSASVIMVYCFYKAMGFTSLPSFLVASFFSIFPPFVEAVSWISQRKTVMNMFFFLLSGVFYFKGYRGLSLISFTASLLSKAISAPFSLLFVLYGITIKGRLDLKSLIASIKSAMPFLAVSLIAVVIFITGQSREDIIRQFNLWSVFQSFLIIIVAPFFWFPSKLFLPVNLNSFYPPLMYENITPIQIIISLLLWVSLFPVVIYACRDRKRLFWFIAFIAELVPFAVFGASVLPRTSIDAAPGGADRHLYHYSLAFFGFIVPGIAYLFREKPNITKASLVLILSAFLLLTIQRNTVWKNDVSLWEDSAKKTPDYFVQQLKLGDAYMYRHGKTRNKNDLEASILHYQKTMKLNPDLAFGYFKLGQMLAVNGDKTGALDNLARAAELQPDSPYPHREMAIIYDNANQPAPAIKAYQRAIDADPDSYALWKEKGLLEFRAGIYDDALESLKQSLNLNPLQPDLHRTMGAIYLKEKKDKEMALRHFEESLRQNPAQDNSDIIIQAINILKKDLGKNKKKMLKGGSQ